MFLRDILTKNCVVTQQELIVDPELLEDVQARLVVWGLYPKHQVDGKWGRLTEGALIGFCKRVHLNSAASRRYGASFASALLGKPTELITGAQAAAIFGRMPTSEQMADLNRCLVTFDINTPARLKHFTSQISHESCCLRYCLELASGAAYEGRKDLGNIYPGDGVKFKGCGWIQVTGRHWHTLFSQFIGDPKVVELGSVYTSKVYPATISGFWWMKNSMNDYIDSGATLEQVTKRINGGFNGILERRKYYAIACKVIS